MNFYCRLYRKSIKNHESKKLLLNKIIKGEKSFLSVNGLSVIIEIIWESICYGRVFAKEWSINYVKNYAFRPRYA